MNELLIKYAEQFKDNFPIFYMRHLDEDQIIKIVQKCLDDGKPYDVDYSDETVVY